MAKKGPWRRKIERDFIRTVTSVAAGAVAHLSLPAARVLGDMVGDAICLMSVRRMQLADRNLRLCFGERLTAAERARIRRFCTRNAAKTMLELLKLPRMSAAEFHRLVSVENPEVLAAAVDQGRGVMVVTAHYGNWELLAAAISDLGHDLHVVARDHADRTTAYIINRARESWGEKVIERAEVRRMIRVLRGGGLLGILPDQHAKTNGVWVDFLGRPASTFTGPARLALQTGALIVPAFGRRTDDDHIICSFHPPLELPRTGDRDRDVLLGTQVINDALAAEILRHPAQWLWLHNRWRTTTDEIARQWQHGRPPELRVPPPQPASDVQV